MDIANKAKEKLEALFDQSVGNWIRDYGKSCFENTPLTGIGDLAKKIRRELLEWERETEKPSWKSEYAEEALNGVKVLLVQCRAGASGRHCLTPSSSI